MSLNLIVNRRVWKGSASELTANATTVFEAGDQIYLEGDFTRVKVGDGVTALSSLAWSEIPEKNHTPFALNATGVLTAAQLLQGVITSTSAAAVAATLPTSAALYAAITGAARGTWFDFAIDNSAGSNTITLTLGTGMTVAGSDILTIAAGKVVNFRLYFKSSTTTTLFREVPPVAGNIVNLTDNSGGTGGGNTIAAVTLTEPADLAAQTVINGQLANAVKTLSTKLNAALTALKAAGGMVAD